MKTAVIYARYSSERQTEQSIEGQLRVCNDYAERNDIVVVDTYIDRAMTGTNDNRTEFQRMLKDSSKQAWDIVLVYKLDRFSRNKYEMAMHKKTLRDNGIKLVSAMENIPDTPEGIILESLLEGMAEYYSAELSQKVKRGMNESRHKGQFTGGHLIYGYKIENKKVVIDEEKANVVREIFEKYASGVFVKDIIADLTERGIYNRGKPFARATIYKMLSNEKYSGIYRYNGELFANIYPRIIPENTYKQVREKIDENHYGKHNSTAIYLLKNKVICGYCGKSIASETGTSKNGKLNRYYKCRGRKNLSNGCKKTPIRKDLLEQLVIDVTFKIFNNLELITSIANNVIELHKKRLADQSLLVILNKEKNNIQKSIDNLLYCMEQGIITNSTKNRIEDLEEKLETIKTKIIKEESKDKVYISKDEIIRFIKITLKKEPIQILKSLIDKIILYDDRIEIYYNYIDPQRINPDDDHQDFLFHNDIFEISNNKNNHNKKSNKIKVYTFI